MQDRITILLVDDHPLIRTGLREVIDKHEDFKVIGEVGDGQSALDLLRETPTRVAILDLKMPVMNGLDTARRIVSEKIKTEIIILTMYDDEEMFNEAMDIGVLGYVLKDSASVDIVKAIRSVLKGEYFISPKLSSYAMKAKHDSANDVDPRIGLFKLSPSELRILKLIAEQKTTTEIASLLSISARTVDNHRTNICHKLGLSGINSLLRFALTHRGQL